MTYACKNCFCIREMISSIEITSLQLFYILKIMASIDIPSKMNTVFQTVNIAISHVNDVHKSLSDALQQIKDQPHDYFNTIKPPLKIQFFINMEYTTPSEETQSVYVSTKQFAIVKNITDKEIDAIKQDFVKASDEAQLRGSGWSLGDVHKIELKLSKYHPILGKSYIPLDPQLMHKRGILNIKNKDERCFMWCVLAKLFPSKANPELTSSYKKHIGKLDFDDIEFPMKVDDIDMFEAQNPGLSINVYTWDKQLDTDTGCGLQPLRVSKNSPTFDEPDKNHIDLCLIENQHFTLIRTMSRLINKTSKEMHKQFLC